MHGGRGAISVGSNIAPRQYADFHNAMMAGDFAEAQRLNALLDRLHKDLFIDPSPAPAKYALSLLGRMDDRVRLPITPCREETKAKVRSAMIRAGIDL
jgi:4-hydroxy-tetrahydrodipicolinate synthase